MTRITIALVAFLVALPAARGSVSSSADRAGFGERATRDVAVASAPRPAEEQELMVTDRTEIQLDGKACSLDGIPPGVEMFYLEVARDRRTIVKMHFRSK